MKLQDPLVKYRKIEKQNDILNQLDAIVLTNIHHIPLNTIIEIGIQTFITALTLRYDNQTVQNLIDEWTQQIFDYNDQL